MLTSTQSYLMHHKLTWYIENGPGLKVSLTCLASLLPKSNSIIVSSSCANCFPMLSHSSKTSPRPKPFCTTTSGSSRHCKTSSHVFWSRTSIIPRSCCKFPSAAESRVGVTDPVSVLRGDNPLLHHSSRCSSYFLI